MNALEVTGLCKKYPKFTLDNVSFSVGEGRVCGLIGRNGAGKSTTLKAIMRLIAAEGRVKVFGRDFAAEEAAVKSDIGFVGGGFGFYPLKKIKAVSKAFASFYPNWNEGTYRKYLSDFGIDEEKKPSELSEGMKVKYSLALALSHGARLLVMDEPTSGLDPLSREEFCDIVLELTRENGVSVLFPRTSPPTSCGWRTTWFIFRRGASSPKVRLPACWARTIKLRSLPPQMPQDAAA